MGNKANEQGSFCTPQIEIACFVCSWKSYICYRATGPGTERVDRTREGGS